MTLDDQLCLPSQARKLKDLGIYQDALFYGTIAHNDKWDELVSRGDFTTKLMHKPDHHYLAAFNVAELGIMLNHSPRWDEEESEAVSRAGFLIELLEDGGITAAEANDRLKPKL